MKVKKHILYVGLNDKDAKLQKISTKAAQRVIMRLVDKNKYDGATISDATGFYKYNDGVRGIEKTLRVEIMFADTAKTQQLIKDLKTELNQESIALETSTVNSQLV